MRWHLKAYFFFWTSGEGSKYSTATRPEGKNETHMSNSSARALARKQIIVMRIAIKVSMRIVSQTDVALSGKLKFRNHSRESFYHFGTAIYEYIIHTLLNDLKIQIYSPSMEDKTYPCLLGNPLMHRIWYLREDSLFCCTWLMDRMSQIQTLRPAVPTTSFSAQTVMAYTRSGCW